MGVSKIVFSMVLNNTDFVKKMDLSWKKTHQLERMAAQTDGALKKMVMGGLTPMIGKLSAFAGGAALVGGALSRSMEKMMALDTALAEMKALTGATAEQMERFKTAAIGMSSSTTVAADEIIRAMIKVGGAMPQLLGFEQGLKNVTQSAITLSEASGMGLDDSINSLTGIMNQFGASAMDSDRYINALAAASQAGSAEIDYLAEAVAKSGGAATSADMEFEELISLIEAVAPKFGKAEEAGTALRGVLLKMETGGEKTKISTQGLARALDELAKMNSDEMLKKFGVEGYNMAKAMVDARDSFAKFNTEVRGTNAAQEQAQIRADNLRGAIDQLANKWDAFTTSVNESNGTLTKFVNLLGDAVDKMADLADEGDDQSKWIRKQKRDLDKSTPKDASKLVGRWEKMGLSKEEAIDKALDDVWSHIQVFEGKGQIGKDDRNNVKLALEGFFGSKWKWSPGDTDLTAINGRARFNDNISYPAAKYGGPLAMTLGWAKFGMNHGWSANGILKAAATGGLAGYFGTNKAIGPSSKEIASTLNTHFPTGEMSDMLGLYKWYQMKDYLNEYKKSLKEKPKPKPKGKEPNPTVESADPEKTIIAGLDVTDLTAKKEKIRELESEIAKLEDLLMLDPSRTDIISTLDRLKEQLQQIKPEIDEVAEKSNVAVQEIEPAYTNPWEQKYQDNWQNGNSFQRVDFAADAAGIAANGMNSVGNLVGGIPGLEESGKAINEVTSTIMEAIGVIQGVSAIIEMVDGVKAATQTAAIAANTGVLVANTGAIAALTSAVGANTFSNFLPFFSDGGIVGGSSFTGDKLLARVNSGEAILNREQQKRALAQMGSTVISSKIAGAETIVKGEDLYVTLTNYLSSTGKKI